MDEDKTYSGCHHKGGYLFLVLGLLIVVMMVLTFSRPIPAPVVNVATSQDYSRNTLTVSGNSRLTVAADEALAYVSVVDNASTARAAQDANRVTSNAVIAALKAWGINSSDLETEDYSLEKIQEWEYYKDPVLNGNNGKYVDKGYKVTHTLKVTTTRVQDVGSLIDAAVAAGANGVDRVDFDLTKATEVAVRDEALMKATVVAGQKAQKLASTAGATLGKVRTITEQSFYYTPFSYNVNEMKLSAGAADAAAPTTISPQKVDVTSSVQLVYDIS